MSKKEESEVEEEETPVITLRRSARGRGRQHLEWYKRALSLVTPLPFSLVEKREEKSEAAQDSEVDDTASNSTMTSAVNSPAPSHGCVCVCVCVCVCSALCV